MILRTHSRRNGSDSSSTIWITVLVVIALVARSSAFSILRLGGAQRWIRARYEEQRILPIGPEVIPHDVLTNPNSSCAGDEHKGISHTSLETLPALLKALEVMQSHFFQIWQGTWPTTSDWTAEVMSIHVCSALATLTSSTDHWAAPSVGEDVISLGFEAQAQENLINRYFTHLTSFYFGENTFSLRTQAYDDMLWVVLNWLDNINFVKLHSALHHPSSSSYSPEADCYNSTTWHGAQFIPAFAHRARVFYDIASQGWDTSLCDGGMIWSPYLAPYKNAITNELYITASISMYLYFPGDDNPSPFASDKTASAKPHDPRFLRAAVEAYQWLLSSNMTNGQGLYVDGYHIHGWGRDNNSIGSGKCDVRNEMVYTYNQGTLLSGLRGLWESTGVRDYLEDGHKMIRNVIAATGWQLADDDRERWRWAGLGRNGILEEYCDASGRCTQDGQTFKGIFFHHLTSFCTPLPEHPAVEGRTFAADTELQGLHDQSCKEYGPWISHNAQAVLDTKDQDGEFGMWWGRRYGGRDGIEEDQALQDGAVDYRNLRIPMDDVWDPETYRGNPSSPPRWRHKDDVHANWDLNDRGRGRTVETQGGGLAVLRAKWELVDRLAL
ncbi:MAG: hypothetical protein M1827_003808 [Pycnora praestabilis]|nr:MAG: hypothetical protein M1827_003808 [Pycnora praestabilis]